MPSLGAAANGRESEVGSGEHAGGLAGGVNSQWKGGAGASSKGSPLKDGLKRLPKASGPSDDESIDVKAGIAVYCDNGTGKRTQAILRVRSILLHSVALPLRRCSRRYALLGLAQEAQTRCFHFALHTLVSKVLSVDCVCVCVCVCHIYGVQFDAARRSFVCSMEEEGDVVADYRYFDTHTRTWCLCLV